MAHKVELPPPWWERGWVWVILAVAVLGVWGVLREASTPAPASAPVASVAVPEMTLSCGGDKEYRRLPDVKNVVVIVEPTGKNCWTAWLRRPEKATYLYLDPESDIDSEMAFGEGKIVQRHDSPLIHRYDPQSMNAVRYQNPGDKPVRIPITINY